MEKKYRHELKIHINNFDIIQLEKRLSLALKIDVNSDNSGYYKVNSMYFDNYKDKALMEKVSGYKYREKFRIRFYNNQLDYIKLEKKIKNKNLTRKESVNISKEDCENIINGEIEIKDKSNLFNEFYSKYKNDCLRPVIIVNYDRKAFVYPYGNIRITLDTNIKRSKNIGNFLEGDYTDIKISDISVLEIKYGEFIPQWISDLVQIGNRGISGFSKYASSRII